MVSSVSGEMQITCCVYISEVIPVLHAVLCRRSVQCCISHCAEGQSSVARGIVPEVSPVLHAALYRRSAQCCRAHCAGGQPQCTPHCARGQPSALHIVPEVSPVLHAALCRRSVQLYTHYARMSSSAAMPPNECVAMCNTRTCCCQVDTSRQGSTLKFKASGTYI